MLGRYLGGVVSSSKGKVRGHTGALSGVTGTTTGTC